MTGRMKLRDRLSKFVLNHEAFEAKAVEFIELLEKSAIPGEDKKKAVMDRLRQWIDDQIALTGFWELLSDIAIRVAMIFVSGWVESVFKRWKANKAAAAVAVDKEVVKRQTKSKEDKS